MKTLHFDKIARDRAVTDSSRNPRERDTNSITLVSTFPSQFRRNREE